MAILGILSFGLSVYAFNLDRVDARTTDEGISALEDNITSVNQKIDRVIQEHQTFRDCDNSDAMFDVQNRLGGTLPEPFRNWMIRGNMGVSTLEPGLCTIDLLFGTYRSDGEMTEANVTYTSEEPVTISSVNSMKTPDDKCSRILISKQNGVATVGGILRSEKLECYYFDVAIGRTVNLELGPDRSDVVASVVDVGDANDEWHFVAAERRYEFHVWQLRRHRDLSLEYYLKLSIN